MAAIIAFRHSAVTQSWSNEELAELYRVVDILNRAGVPIDTDMGLSDEGDPWFAFCRKDTCDVIVHFSRIDGQFIAVSATTNDVVRGSNFRRVAEALVNRQPLILPSPTPGQKLFLHPAVILTALVATALAQMKSWDGQNVGDGVLFDDAADGDAGVTADISFAEVLKTAFLDAMNFVLRGVTGPVDIKNGLADLGQSATHNLGLGSLSLASVVAFAISVIQGSPLPDETEAARNAPALADSATAEAKKAAMAAAAPQDSDASARSDDAGNARLAENKEQITIKAAAARDVALSDKAHKAIAVEKSDAVVSSDESAARHTRKELAEKLQTPDQGTEHIKLAAGERIADVSKDLSQLILTGPEGALITNVENTGAAQYHRFSFTDISKVALEFFFVRLDSNEQSSDPRYTSIALTFERSNGPDDGLSAVPAMRASINASDIVFAGGDPVAMSRLNLITDFVNTTGSRLPAPFSFTDVLSPYWSGDKALTIVVFDSDDLPLNIFSFTNNVLFVEESQLAGFNANFNHNALQVDLANGGDVTLLGVINLGPLTHTA